MPDSRQTSITLTHMDSTGYALAGLLPSDSGARSRTGCRVSETGMTSESDGRPVYGEQMAKYFRLARAPSLVIRPPLKPHIAITHLASDTGLPERTASIPPERAFVVSIHLTPAAERGGAVWGGGRHLRVSRWPAGGVGIYDLESNPRTRNPGPVDWVHYHVPRAAFDAFTDDLGAASIQTLECMHGRVDPVLRQMTQMMLPSVDSAQSFSLLFLDYFRLLFCAHVAHTYAPSFC